tara:strand:+ start:16660 stop:16968 length:309 start_codon:yes stop_codon:yes gene_type:complete
MSKDFVEDGLTNEKINDIIQDIRFNIDKHGTKEHIIKDLKNKYLYFEERYPSLFSTAIEEKFDYNAFEYMMKMREKIINDMTTTEEASKEIGVKFYDKYHKK